MSLRPKSVDFAQTWVDLQSSVAKIITLEQLERKVWDNRYFDIYALCVAVPESYCEPLYSNTRKFIEHHVAELHKEIASCQKGEFLQAYYDRWKVYYKGTNYIHLLYSYLNNQFIKKQKYTDADLTYGALSMEQVRACMLEVGELALEIWKQNMLQPLQDRLVGLLLEAVSCDRAGDSTTNQSVVHGVIQSLVDVEQYKQRAPLELYETMFEKEFLAATANHYQQEAQELLSSSTCSQYMEKVLARIKEEDMRSRKYLHPSSYEKVIKECQEVMIAKHMEFLHSFTKDMVHDEKTDDLSNMHTLLKPIANGLVILVKQFENHVKMIGLNGVMNLKGDNMPMQFVENVLNVYDKYSDMVRLVFNNDQEFWSALDKACLAAINYKEDSKACPKASEWLAKYTDYLLRKSAKGLSESEIDEKLTRTIIIFRYIEDKDVFQKFYSRMLAQRLIHSVSVSMDAEEMMINKLKQACGYEFTSKLHRMFTDIGVSKSLTERFHTFLEGTNTSLDVGFQILVLQAGAWPLSNQVHASNFSVPVILQPSVTHFEEFYNKNFSGRKLTWLYSFAYVDLKLSYLPRAYVITMSVHQASILLHFNDQDAVSVQLLQEGTQLALDILTRNVKSLIDSGLIQTTNTTATTATTATAAQTQASTSSEVSLDEATVLSLNMAYTNKRTKFKLVAPVVQKQAERETEQVNTTLQQDRKYFLECTIVRIMKARKILRHNLLVQEVICQSRSRFIPEIPLIKKTIEQLIEKQYLQRTENPDEYAYLA